MPLLNRRGDEPGTEAPKEVLERIKRGETKLERGASKRMVCWKFWRGEHYFYVDKDNYLASQGTVRGEQAKPNHRVRKAHNLIFDFVEHDVSLAVSRIPAYEVGPSTMDAEDVSAAKLSEKILRYGYEKWDVKSATEAVVRHCEVAKMGFCRPYFDKHLNEICLKVYGLNEVSWEPGLRFRESPWLMIQQARLVDQVMQEEGYIGGKLEPDAKHADMNYTQKSKDSEKLVLVTDYLERPTPGNPSGRWITVANKRQILEERTYPLLNGRGETINEPVLRDLSYAPDPDADEDVGLVEQLLDPMRTYNDAANKESEWKNLAMNPQVVIRNGVWRGPKLNDEPGMVYRMVGSSAEAQWREVPAMPPGLGQIKDSARSEMAQIAAQNDIPSQVESGKAITALIERDQSRRANFISRLAEFYSRVGSDCLALAQQFYTEEKILTLRGRFGPELETGFRGANLRDQTDVTVRPGSIEPRTKAMIEQRVMNYAQLGWISPEAAMAAIDGGTAESLASSYELDVERANLVIEKIRMGPDVLFAVPPRLMTDPMTGMQREVPGYMPRPEIDNLRIHKAVVSDWMKTTDFDRLDPAMQAAAMEYLAAVEQGLTQEKIKEAQEQQAMAASLGMGNAAAPQGASPLPSLPGMNGQSGGQPAQGPPQRG
jgi:hypothetical protein